MNGKNARFFAVVATAALSGTVAHAIPRSGESSGQHFLVSAEDLNSWHVGVYGRAQERTVEVNGRETTFDLGRGMALVGYDVLSWVTIYGTLGVSDASSDEYDVADGTALEYGGGAWFNLLDHDTLDFLELVQRFRVQAALQYTYFDNDDFSWGELSGNVTFGFVHELVGSKFFWPQTITLFAGPCVNSVNSDEFDVSSDNSAGMLVGLDVQVNERTALSLASEFYSDDVAYVAAAVVRF